MSRTLITALLMTISLLAQVATIFAQTPRTISYQGVLADQSGDFLPDGIHAISVSLYDAPTGGAPLYQHLLTALVFHRASITG